MRVFNYLILLTVGLGLFISAEVQAQTHWHMHEQGQRYDYGRRYDHGRRQEQGHRHEFPHRHDVFVPISKYISYGDAERLSAWFDENLEICIFTNSCDASKSQATHILRHFFRQHHPRSFRVTHSVERNNMKHALGQLKTSSESFIVTIFVSTEENNYKIQQLKIERQ